MGGLHSGRKRTHTRINDCIVIDLALLKKQKILVPGRYSLQANKWHETNFHERKKYSYQVQMIVSSESVRLFYSVSRPGVEAPEYLHDHAVSLTSTACNYGGLRLWFLAPCCGARVRVLYINPQQTRLQSVRPQCRVCLDLHYESQLSGYIEQHKTYERHLLANYGLTWAEWRYEYELREHYQEVTPELELKRARSECEERLHTLRLLIRTMRFLARTDRAAIDSLKSEEDTRMYVLHMLAQCGEGHIEQVVCQLRKPEKRVMVERIMSDWREELAGKKNKPPILDFNRIVEKKRQVEAELQMLRAA